MTTRAMLALGIVLLLAGCVGGPSYAGGPREDEPHAVVIPGEDVTIWAVDGYDVPSHSSTAYLAPGRRKLRVRIEFPIENESPTPYEYKEMDVTVEDGDVILLSRSGGEDAFGPYDVEVKRARR